MTNEEIQLLLEDSGKLLTTDPLELHARLTNFLTQFDEIALRDNKPEEEVIELKAIINKQMCIVQEEIGRHDELCMAEFVLAQRKRELSEALHKLVINQKHGRD